MGTIFLYLPAQDTAQIRTKDGEGDDRFGDGRMSAEKFFHPGDVVPAAEFIAAAVKDSDHGVSYMSVELDAVLRYVFVVGVGTGDAGI